MIRRIAVPTSTILPATTMTTNPRVDVSRCARSAGFRFVASDDVAVISVIARREPPSGSSITAMHACSARFELLLKRLLQWKTDARLMFFAATPFWEESTELKRRRGLWRRSELLWLNERAGVRSPDVEMVSGASTRFSGIAVLDTEAVADAAEHLRTHASSFLFIASAAEPTEERVRQTFSNVFPEGGTAIDWRRAIDHLGTDMSACMRATGSFDDPDVSIDMFTNSELHSLAAEHEVFG